jgi:hypothetical protein
MPAMLLDILEVNVSLNISYIWSFIPSQLPDGRDIEYLR